MKRGFTIIELLIAIALLTIIMAATMTLYTIGIKNYRLESQRNNMQQDINYVADDLGTSIKQAAKSPASYDTYSRGESTLILALPAIDSNENFVYSGETLLYDYLIYQKTDNKITKTLISDTQSVRENKSEALLENVSEFICSYNPQTETEIVSCSIRTAHNVSGTTLSFEAIKTARLRNKR